MPLDIDILQKSEYNISVRFSKVVELVSAVHMLSDPKHHSFDEEWAQHTIANLSPQSKELLEMLSKLNFPSLELLDFVILDESYEDIPAFINSLREYNSIDFLHRLLDEKFSREQLIAAPTDKGVLDSITAEIPWILKGSESFLSYMLTNAEDYQNNVIGLLQDIYSCGFEEKLKELEDRYIDSLEIMKQRLTGRNPVEVAEEVKGSKFSSKNQFGEYIFTPSYFFHHHNIISYNQYTFLMIFNINIDNSFDDGEAERLSELLKVLSDKTRLEILRQLKRRSTYGKVLASRLNLTTATISRHLDQLKKVNLIQEDKNSHVKYYYVNSDEIDKLLNEIRQFIHKK